MNGTLLDRSEFPDGFGGVDELGRLIPANFDRECMMRRGSPASRLGTAAMMKLGWLGST